MPSISAMFGGVDYCYAHRPIDASNASSCHEYNVAENASASRAMVAASWPMVITPLDTCEVAMSGAPWAQMQAANFSGSPMVTTLLASMFAWNHQYAAGCSQSDVIFDAVALYMTRHPEALLFSQVALAVTEAGATMRDPLGKPVQAALSWAGANSTALFFARLVRWLSAFSTADPHAPPAPDIDGPAPTPNEPPAALRRCGEPCTRHCARRCQLGAP